MEFKCFIFILLWVTLKLGDSQSREPIRKGNQPFLVVLRGPAGAGKSSTSRQLLKLWRELEKKLVSYIDWDYIRETLLAVNIVPLVTATLSSLIQSSLSQNFSVLIDGSIFRPDYDNLFLLGAWDDG